MLKIYGIAGISLLIIIYSAGMALAGYSYAMKGKGDAIQASLKEDGKKVAEAKQEARVVEKVVIKYVDKIKTVVDTTGCADMPADPVISDSLLNIYSATARPSPD